MRRGPEDPRPRSLLATSASRAPEQLRLAHPRSVVAGKARCRRTLDALSAPWAAALGKLPPELASTIPRSGATTPRPLPQGALSPPSTANRGRHAPPTLREPSIHRRREPATDDTPAGIAVTRRRRIGEAVHNGQVNMGQTQQAGAEWIGRRPSTQAASPLRSTGRPFPSSGPPICGPGQDGRLKPTPRARGPWRRSLHGRARASDASCQHESPRFRDA